jgi:hypothetical protein
MTFRDLHTDGVFVLRVTAPADLKALAAQIPVPVNVPSWSSRA